MKNRAIEKKIILLLVLCGLFFPGSVKGQDSLGKFSFVLAPDFYFPSVAKPESGFIKPNFLPSFSGHFELGFRFWSIKNRAWYANYSFGITTWRLANELDQDQYPILRNSVDWKFWGVHRYHSVGMSVRIYLGTKHELRIGLSNRFYVSGHTGFSVGSVRASTQTRLTVFRAEAYAPIYYFCPELNLSYVRSIWQKFPFLKLVFTASIAPSNAFETSYTYFPNDPQYLSTGSYRIMQSYISVGVCYQRIIRD